jgi:hypothetical protein
MHGWFERLWPRSFVYIVCCLAGLTPYISLTPGADLQDRSMVLRARGPDFLLAPGSCERPQPQLPSHPRALAQLARGTMRGKIRRLEEALECSFFTDQHAAVLSMMLTTIDHYSAQID